MEGFSKLGGGSLKLRVDSSGLLQADQDGLHLLGHGPVGRIQTLGPLVGGCRESLGVDEPLSLAGELLILPPGEPRRLDLLELVGQEVLALGPLALP